MRETTLGRMIFNEVLPEEFEYSNEVADKKTLKKIVINCYNK